MVFWYHVLVLDMSVCQCVHVVTRVALDEATVQVSQLLSADVSGRVVGGLEVQVVLSTAVELGGGHIHPDDDLVGVTGLLDGRLQQLQSCTRSKHNVSIIPDGLKLSEEPSDRENENTYIHIKIYNTYNNSCMLYLHNQDSNT